MAESIPNEKPYALVAATPQRGLEANIEFRAWGAYVDNFTSAWVELPDASAFVPPNTFRVLPLPGVTVLKAQFRAPPGVAQPVPTIGQTCFIKATERQVQPTGGPVGATALASVATLERFLRANIPAAGSAGRMIQLIDDDQNAWLDNGTRFYSVGGEVVPLGAYGMTSAGLQAAHDALPASGGTILAPRGTVSLSAGVIFTKPIALIGSGEATILRATAAFTALIELQAGASDSLISLLRLEGFKSGVGGALQRGVYINGAERVTVSLNHFTGPVNGTGLNFGVDVYGRGTHLGKNRIFYNTFDRTVSSGGNGAGVLLEQSDHNQVYGNEYDGLEFNNADGAPSSAIALTSSTDGTGCRFNLICSNWIHDHKQVGISVNSTTYADFSANLGACTLNTICHNDIHGSDAAGGGDASSGIAQVGNSSFNRYLHNKIHGNGNAAAGGYGMAFRATKSQAFAITGATNATPIVITAVGHTFANGNTVGVSGVLGNTAANGTWLVANVAGNTFELATSVGNGAYAGGGRVGITGTAAADEIADRTEIRGNFIYENQDDGILLDGVTNTIVGDNEFYQNGQRTANTFGNLTIQRVNAVGPTGDGTVVTGNRAGSTRPSYQVKIGAGVTGTKLHGNALELGATGRVLDSGTASQVDVTEDTKVPDAVGRWDYDWTGRLGTRSTVVGSGSISFSSLTGNTDACYFITGVTNNSSSGGDLVLGDSLNAGLNGVGKCRLLQIRAEWGDVANLQQAAFADAI